MSPPLHRNLLRRFWDPCPLCGSVHADEIYRTRQHTGSFGGLLETRLDMCRDCDFVFSNPRPDEESLRCFYDADPNASGQVYRCTGPGSDPAALAAARLEFIRQEAPRTLTLLDMGCGRGDFLRELGRCTPWRLTGVDPSTAAAALARTAGQSILRANLEEAITVLPPHDAVTLIGVLEHVRDPVRFLTRLGQLLAPGGRLFVEVPDTTQPVASLVEFFDFEHLGHFTLATLTKMLARAGWRLQACDAVQRAEGRLLVSAARDDDPLAAPAPAVDQAGERRALLDGLTRYRENQAALVADFNRRLSPTLARWKRQGARVAIYGAGLHTDYLLGCLPELESSVYCLLDSDPRKQGQAKGAWRIHGPGDIDRLQLDAILVSSRSGETDIMADLGTARQAGIEVVGCYQDPSPRKPARRPAARSKAARPKSS